MDTILLVNRLQIHTLAIPLELSTAPKDSAAPWLRTTALNVRKKMKKLGQKLTKTKLFVAS